MITSHTPRRAAILAGAAFLSLILAGACILSARADRASGNWGGNTIALQNLWPLPQSYTGTLLAPDGQILWTHTGVVTPYGTLYLTPAVASGVTGTLLLDSEGLTAGAIAHLEDGAGEIGNDVYELKLDGDLATTYVAPALEKNTLAGGFNSIVAIHNRSAQSAISATVVLYNLGGTPAVTRTFTVNASVDYALSLETGLPPAWHGGARITTGGSALVQVSRTDGQTYESYTAIDPADSAPRLVLPWVAPYQPGILTSTVDVFNPNASTAAVTVTFATGQVSSAALAPMGSAPILAPLNIPAPTVATVTASLPVAAVTRLLSRPYDRRGTLDIAAYNPLRLSRHVAVALLYSGYLGWGHQWPAGAVRIYNASSTLSAAVHLSYRPVDAGAAPVLSSTTLAPLQYTDDFPPPSTSARWSLVVDSTQAVAVTVIGYQAGGTSYDHWFAYRGRAYAGLPLFFGRFNALLPAAAYNLP